MAMGRKFEVPMGLLFPAGAYLLGEVEAVADFNAEARADGSRPQSLDKDTGLPVWSVSVVDADPEAGKKEKSVTVKLLATHQPVPPKNDTEFPFTPVVFEGITVTPWIEENGNFSKIAWSIRATGMSAPRQSGPSRKQEAA